MSWDKNTINCSNLDAVLTTLKELEIPYKLRTLGKISGCGLNDEIWDENGMTTIEYKIRKLTYKDFVMLEQMVRSSDCDMNDYIMSYKFRKKDAPKKWNLEIMIDNMTGERIIHDNNKY